LAPARLRATSWRFVFAGNADETLEEGDSRFTVRCLLFRWCGEAAVDDRYFLRDIFLADALLRVEAILRRADDLDRIGDFLKRFLK
jgi:hypothetical protein